MGGLVALCQVSPVASSGSVGVLAQCSHEGGKIACSLRSSSGRRGSSSPPAEKHEGMHMGACTQLHLHRWSNHGHGYGHVHGHLHRHVHKYTNGQCVRARTHVPHICVHAHVCMPKILLSNRTLGCSLG